MNRFRSLFTMQIVAGLLCVQAIAIDTVDHQNGESAPAHQHDVIDIRFQVAELSSQPIDVEFSAVFESDSGQSIPVAGLYNGQNEYRIRFTPPTVGNWSYATHSTTAALDGKSGQLSVQPAREGRRGGVIVDPKLNSRFKYENGDSYYPIAFESDWLFALDAENELDIPVTRNFVDTLAENGFNQVVINVFAYDVDRKKDDRLDSKYDDGSPRVFPFGGDNEHPDFEKLNVEYFRRLDRVIDYLDRKDIVAHLMIYVWNKRVAWPTHYWQGAAWNVIFADIDAMTPEDRPRLDYYRHMRAFVDRFKPDQLIAGDQKSNAGFCLHNGKESFLYYVPKECDYFGLRLPKDRGNTMTVTWFDPITGTFSEPKREKIPQWPTLKTPEADDFHLLIVKIDEK